MIKCNWITMMMMMIRMTMTMTMMMVVVVAVVVGGGGGSPPFAWKITWCPWAAPGILAKARRLQLADASFRDLLCRVCTPLSENPHIQNVRPFAIPGTRACNPRPPNVQRKDPPPSPGYSWTMISPNNNWLVVLTILKNICQWEGLSHILWKKNVWNQQPE